MSDLLENTTLTTRTRHVPDTGPAPPGATPPATPSDQTTSPHGPWPREAKVIVAVLAVAALLAVAGTWAAMRGSDSTDQTTIDEQQEQIDLLTTQLEEANAQVGAAVAQVMDITAQRAALTARITELDAEVADLDVRIAAATEDVGELTAERVTLLSERAELRASLAVAEAQTAAVETRLDNAADVAALLDEQLAILGVQVSYLRDRATTAERERATLLELFPIELDSSLQGVDVRGDWSISWDEAYCTGFGTCGAVPSFDRIAITQTPEGWLRVTAAGVFDAGLFAVEGGLHAITESSTAAPTCQTTPRNAHVGLTLFANTVSIAEDGTHVVEDLGAVYVVEAPATATCPAAIAFYGAELTAAG